MTAVNRSSSLEVCLYFAVFFASPCLETPSAPISLVHHDAAGRQIRQVCDIN